VTKLFIADDHEVVRSGLRVILETRPDWEVIGEASDGKEAIARLVSLKADIAILDYGLPMINGVEVARQIKARQPAIEILMFTMRDDDSVVQQALEAGVRAYLLKSDAKQYLMSAVDSLAAHRPFFTGRISETLLDVFLKSQGQGRKSLLSPRERVVVQLIAEGRSNKEMGDILNVSTKTIEAQRAAAMRKLDIDSTAGLIRYAIRERIVEP
jgi:DNA-binding NarL/FixJ family response regulator